MRPQLYRTIFPLLITSWFGCRPMHERAVDNTSPAGQLSKTDSATVARKQQLMSQLLGADSILLVCHGQTYGPVFNKKKKSYDEAKKIVDSGIINRKVIYNTVRIQQQEKEKLAAILTQALTGEQVPVALCFDPHHAFLIFSNKQVSYIEFCFGCGGVESDQFQVSMADFDQAKWDRIYQYIDEKIEINSCLSKDSLAQAKH